MEWFVRKQKVAQISEVLPKQNSRIDGIGLGTGWQQRARKTVGDCWPKLDKWYTTLTRSWKGGDETDLGDWNSGDHVSWYCCGFACTVELVLRDH